MTIYNKLLKILTLILEMSELLFEARVQNKITKTEGRMRGKTEKGTGERSPQCKIR